MNMNTTKSKNNKKSVTKSKKKMNFCKLVPNLLLNYTYALNTRHTKFICTGFDTSTFKEKIILNDVNGDFIELSSLDWYSIFVKLQKLNSMAHQMITTQTECPVQSKIIVSKTLRFQIRQDINDFHVTISKSNNDKKSTIKFDYEEYANFYAQSEFVHLVVTYNRSASPLISDYFKSYILKCLEFNTLFLTSQYYFTPYDYISHNSINYSRLFHEFSFLCLPNIYSAIEHEKQKNNTI